MQPFLSSMRRDTGTLPPSDLLCIWGKGGSPVSHTAYSARPGGRVGINRWTRGDTEALRRREGNLPGTAPGRVQRPTARGSAPSSRTLPPLGCRGLGGHAGLSFRGWSASSGAAAPAVSALGGGQVPAHSHYKQEWAIRGLPRRGPGVRGPAKLTLRTPSSPPKKEGSGRAPRAEQRRRP